jgi:hypothetical protein
MTIPTQDRQTSAKQGREQKDQFGKDMQGFVHSNGSGTVITNLQ